MIYEFGKHRVKHGSITLGIDDLMGSDKAHIIYSDPPWGQGNISFWQTLNKKDNGAEKQTILYDDFLEMIFSAYGKFSENILFVEYGVRWRADIQERAQRHGFTPIEIIGLEYKGGATMLTLDLHVFAKQAFALPAGYVDRVSGTSGYKTLQADVPPFAAPGKILLDPMCGMGYSAQIAIDTGMSFRLDAGRQQQPGPGPSSLRR